MAEGLPDVKIKIELDTADALKKLQKIESRVKRNSTLLGSLRGGGGGGGRGGGGGGGRGGRGGGDPVSGALRSTARSVSSMKVPDLFKLGANAGISAAQGIIRGTAIAAAGVASIMPFAGPVVASGIRLSGEVGARTVGTAMKAIVPFLEFGAGPATAIGMEALKASGVKLPGLEGFSKIIESKLHEMSEEITRLRSWTAGVQLAIDNGSNAIKASVGADLSPNEGFVVGLMGTSRMIGELNYELQANIKKVVYSQASEVIKRGISQAPGSGG